MAMLESLKKVDFDAIWSYRSFAKHTQRQNTNQEQQHHIKNWGSTNSYHPNRCISADIAVPTIQEDIALHMGKNYRGSVKVNTLRQYKRVQKQDDKQFMK